MTRCPWSESNQLLVAYHDTEWGVPLHDDHKLFEFLILDAFQAGLSWAIVLNKREGLRQAFSNFSATKVAKYGEQDIARLLADAGIIRNKQKILASIENAKQFLSVQQEFGTFAKYIWQFTGGRTITNKHTDQKQLPTTSPEAENMSKDLRQRGFKFVGPTICYAFMQAAGLVNDHLVSCFRWKML
jgi:DNA-3-methyladenine glycosylase I